MKLLDPDEDELIGRWIFANGMVSGNEACSRIEWLTSSVLQLCDGGDLGWERIYVDPKDSRYWLLTYPDGHLQGGGPPKLNVISSKEMAAKIIDGSST